MYSISNNSTLTSTEVRKKSERNAIARPRVEGVVIFGCACANAALLMQKTGGTSIKIIS